MLIKHVLGKTKCHLFRFKVKDARIGVAYDLDGGNKPCRVYTSVEASFSFPNYSPHLCYINNMIFFEKEGKIHVLTSEIFCYPSITIKPIKNSDFIDE